MRSPFDVRLDKPKREGDETLLYAFDARVAWVAVCHHRTSSRISWDLCSSPAVRLEPLFADLLPALSSDDRLPNGKHLRFSVEVGSSSDFEASPLQLRGVVKAPSSRRWRREASHPMSTATRQTLCSSRAARGHLTRGVVQWWASTWAAARVIDVARAWPPDSRRCARRSRRS